MEFPEPTTFIWDLGNKEKNYKNHQVSNFECEEVFFDHDKKIYNDEIHSQREARYLLVGKTKSGRTLFVVFTIRSNKIRVISARNLNHKEYYLYEI